MSHHRGLTTVQRQLWQARRAGAAVRAELGALRVVGGIDEERMMAAIGAVVEQTPILRAGFVTAAGAPQLSDHGRDPAITRVRVDDDERCVDLLRADRDRQVDACRDALIRVHLMRRASDEMLLGLVADPLLLDPRSVYLVLGAIMQAYVGRLRAVRLASFTDAPYGGLSASSWSPARGAWWLRRLRAWHGDACGAGGSAITAMASVDGAPSQVASRELGLDAPRWESLSRVAEGAGNSGWLAIIAIMALWQRARLGRAPVFAATLDLRDYCGLGPVVGPLTDRIVFDVELDGLSEMSVADLVRRAHAGVLDAVVHYVSYHELAELGHVEGIPVPPRPGQLGDVGVNYCRLPPASSATRGESSLAQRGLSVELFAPSGLAVGGALAAPVEVSLAESGAAMAIVVNYDATVIAHDAISDLLATLDAGITEIVAEPETAVRRLIDKEDAWTATMT